MRQRTEEAMPTASMGPESPGDVIRHWLAHMNGRDGTFVAGKRQERDVDEDRRGRYPADHHFGNRHAPRQETEFGLGQHRREAIRVMPVDAGALTNTFESSAKTEDSLRDVRLADGCI